MEFQDVIMKLSISAIAIIIPFIMLAVFNWAHAKYKTISLTWAEKTNEYVSLAVITAIRAVEQMAKSDLIKQESSILKAKAIQFAQSWLNDHGLKGISALTLEAEIEAALLAGLHKIEGQSEEVTQLPSAVGNVVVTGLEDEENPMGFYHLVQGKDGYYKIRPNK